MHRMLLALLVLVLPWPALALDVAAEEPQHDSGRENCGPEAGGHTMCEQGMVFECRLVAGSLERRAGWQWRSNILRGCGDILPATLPDQDGWPPPGMVVVPQIFLNGGQTGLPRRPPITLQPGG